MKTIYYGSSEPEKPIPFVLTRSQKKSLIIGIVFVIALVVALIL